MNANPNKAFEEARTLVMRITKALEQEAIKRVVMSGMLDRCGPPDWRADLEMALKDEEFQRQVAEHNAPVLKEMEDALYRLGIEIDALKNPQSGKAN